MKDLQYEINAVLKDACEDEDNWSDKDIPRIWQCLTKHSELLEQVQELEFGNDCVIVTCRGNCDCYEGDNNKYHLYADQLKALLKLCPPGNRRPKTFYCFNCHAPIGSI